MAAKEQKYYQAGLLHTFQDKAWQDGDTMIELLRHYKNSKNKHGITEKTMLVMDNLECHISQQIMQEDGLIHSL